MPQPDHGAPSELAVVGYQEDGPRIADDGLGDADLGIQELQAVAGIGLGLLDLLAGAAFVHQGQRATGIIAEDDGHLVKDDRGLLHHSPTTL